LLVLVLAVVTAAIVVALLDSEVSGTGAENVGESGPEQPAVAPEPREEKRMQRRCKATQSNPGGTNNYIPGAPRRAGDVVVRPAGVALGRLAAALHPLLLPRLGRDRRLLGTGLPDVLGTGSGHLAVQERHHDRGGDHREHEHEQPGSPHVKPRAAGATEWGAGTEARS